MESVEDIVKKIQQADEIQLNEFIGAVARRYNALHKDREGAFLSLTTDPYARDKELEDIIQFIRSCYNQPDSNKC